MVSIWVFSMTLCAVLSIIPALIVGVWLWRGIGAVERRLEGMEMRKLDVDMVQASIGKIREEVHEQAAKLNSVEESLTYINNKWNARLKYEQKEERRKKEKEEEENTSPAGGAGNEPYQYSMFPVPSSPTPAPRRRFGEMP